VSGGMVVEEFASGGFVSGGMVVVVGQEQLSLP
jgi:hypothetical protein